MNENKLFHIGVKALILNENKILLIKSSSKRGYWEVPGGRIFGSETIEETLKRELKEELEGIQNITINNLLMAQRLNSDLPDGNGLILLYYTVAANVDDKAKLSSEHIEYRWFPVDEALALCLAEEKSGISHAQLSDVIQLVQKL